MQRGHLTQSAGAGGREGFLEKLTVDMSPKESVEQVGRRSLGTLVSSKVRL